MSEPLPQAEAAELAVSSFIPGADAIRCCDCDGVYHRAHRSRASGSSLCPGCGSRHGVPLDAPQRRRREFPRSARVLIAEDRW